MSAGLNSWAGLGLAACTARHLNQHFKQFSCQNRAHPHSGAAIHAPAKPLTDARIPDRLNHYNSANFDPQWLLDALRQQVRSRTLPTFDGELYRSVRSTQGRTGLFIRSPSDPHPDGRSRRGLSTRSSRQWLIHDYTRRPLRRLRNASLASVAQELSQAVCAPCGWEEPSAGHD